MSLQVLKALPKFFQIHILGDRSRSHTTFEGQYKVQYIRTVGLLGSFKAPLLAGVADAVIYISNPDHDVYVAAVEVKLSTIRNATEVQ